MLKTIQTHPKPIKTDQNYSKTLKNLVKALQNIQLFNTVQKYCNLFKTF